MKAKSPAVSTYYLDNNLMGSSKTNVYEETQDKGRDEDKENTNHLKPTIYEPSGRIIDIEPPNFDKIPKLVQESALSCNLLSKQEQGSVYDSKMLSKRS